MTSLGRIYEQERKQYGDLCMATGMATGKATVYVELVDKKMQEKGMTEKEACNDLGIAPDTYMTAKTFINLTNKLLPVK